MFKIFRHQRLFLKTTFILIALTCSSIVFADDLELDSTKNTHKLQAVTVNGTKLQSSRATLPLQILSSKELSTLNAYNIADVAKHFAGVTVKDYGGIGGIKTISVRGLGALHTGVSYDGMIISDIQSGQVDLSRFSNENLSEVSLANGQPNNLLQPARMFSYSSVLNFTTLRPLYDSTQTISGKLTGIVGSFGLYNPILTLSKNISKKWALSLIANVLTANGEYKFKSNLNPLGSNWVEKKRINADVKSLRTELNSSYNFNDFEYLNVKMNYQSSRRGIPGSDTYYLSYSTERMNDNNSLMQMQYQNRKNCRFQQLFAAKLNHSEMQYTEQDPKFGSFPNHTRIDNYTQNEYYLTATAQYYIWDNFTMSSSLDWFYNNLFSNSNLGFREDARPYRHTGLANLAAKYSTDKIVLSANILYTLTREKNQDGSAAPNRDKLSPTICFSTQLFDNKDLRFRTFYKNIFRLPTFNELYYHDFGYSKLLPESSNQLNTGIIYSRSSIDFISSFECSADAYYNRITNKISTIYGNPFSSVRNIGRVDVKGCDVNLKMTKTLNDKSTIYFNANYTFQLAQDYTFNSETYGNFTPYSPIHSSTGSLSYKKNAVEFGYNLLFSGKRYSDINNYSGTLLKPFIDHSIFSRISIKKISIMAEVLNIANMNYDIVQFYPMPGRNYRLTLNYKF